MRGAGIETDAAEAANLNLLMAQEALDDGNLELQKFKLFLSN